MLGSVNAVQGHQITTQQINTGHPKGSLFATWLYLDLDSILNSELHYSALPGPT